MKKKLLIAGCLVLSAAICLWQYGTTVTAQDTLIRFHVIANSDSGPDQAVKLKVRDAVLAEYAQKLESCGGYEEAYNFLWEHREGMTAIAQNTLKEWGFSYGAKVEMGRDIFPTKSYGDLTLPAGEYQAVKIVLGQGQGKNWWCVMFPPLCFVDVSKNVGVAKLEKMDTSETGDVVAANGGITQVKVKSKIAELLE